MPTGKGFGQALVIARATSEASGPGKAALDHPAPRQQDKAALGLGRLHHDEPYPMRFGLVGGGRAGVARSTKATSTLSSVLS